MSCDGNVQARSPSGPTHKCLYQNVAEYDPALLPIVVPVACLHNKRGFTRNLEIPFPMCQWQHWICPHATLDDFATVLTFYNLCRHKSILAARWRIWAIWLDESIWKVYFVHWRRDLLCPWKSSSLRNTGLTGAVTPGARVAMRSLLPKETNWGKTGHGNGLILCLWITAPAQCVPHDQWRCLFLSGQWSVTDV